MCYKDRLMGVSRLCVPTLPLGKVFCQPSVEHVPVHMPLLPESDFRNSQLVNSSGPCNPMYCLFWLIGGYYQTLIIFPWFRWLPFTRRERSLPTADLGEHQPLRVFFFPTKGTLIKPPVPTRVSGRCDICEGIASAPYRH